MNYIFGPVPSRRLGASLGIDIIPSKTCSLNCAYCQAGLTDRMTIERRQWVNPHEVLSELKSYLQNEQEIDYITFSGSGEPTLNSALGFLISQIKLITKTPVAVITNSTLLHIPEVRRDICQADLVIPSLDAASEDVFSTLNRPHQSLKCNDIINGLKDFRTEFSGRMWLEVMLVKGINDNVEELKKIAAAIKEINPDKIQLNTVVRPPPEQHIRPVSSETLAMVHELFELDADPILDYSRPQRTSTEIDLSQEIMRMLKRRQCSADQIGVVLGKHADEIAACLAMLIQTHKISMNTYQGVRYYQASKE